METIVCQSYESFMDMCNNNLVKGKNIHCTFNISDPNITDLVMVYEFKKRGGMEITWSKMLKERLNHESQ